MSSRLVLNVNDHPANLYLVTKMLRNAGYEVEESKSGQGALARVAREPKPELVVLDVMLPDVNGYEVCKRIKADAHTADIKVLHTSATFVTVDKKVQGLEAGADGYLTQPFEPQDLVATVRSLIRLRDAERELQSRNDSLVAADRRKDEFLAMLAHELRNPLAAIRMCIPALTRHAPRDHVESRAWEALERQTVLLTRLIDDLLDVARVTHGRIELRPGLIDLRELVRGVTDGFRDRVAAPRRQVLSVALPPDPVPVLGDPGRLEQVLTNLLDNASKYSDAGAPIALRLGARDGQATLTVRDRGVGIDAATLPTIFELFAQSAQSLARSRGGLGIGLTLVKSLVEMHGGRVEARSGGEGQGSEFAVHLPLAPAEVRDVRPRVSDAGASAACRVLLVEDNDDGREMLRSLCELDGHHVDEAPDGPRGVEAALARIPDVALIDVGLPGLDGYEVARRIRSELGPRAPYMVAVSGYSSSDHRQRATEAGFDQLVVKPMEREVLRRVLAVAPRRGAP